MSGTHILGGEKDILSIIIRNVTEKAEMFLGFLGSTSHFDLHLPSRLSLHSLMKIRLLATFQGPRRYHMEEQV